MIVIDYAYYGQDASSKISVELSEVKWWWFHEIFLDIFNFSIVNQQTIQKRYQKKCNEYCIENTNIMAFQKHIIVRVGET